MASKRKLFSEGKGPANFHLSLCEMWFSVERREKSKYDTHFF